MTRKFEITYSNSAKINTGNYEQISPMYCVKALIDDAPQGFSEVKEFARLKEMVDPLLKQYVDAQKKDLAHVRIRMKDGKQYPSVTSILNPVPFALDEEYAIRGTEIHELVTKFVLSGLWHEPKVALKKLTYDEIKYKEFFETFKKEIFFKDEKLNVEVFNLEHQYSGEIDLICEVNGKRSLVDIKTGAWKWGQLIAYWKALNDPTVKQCAVFDLKKGKLEELEMTSPKARKAWEDFLIALGAFRTMYEI